ncbi:mannose-6-phosphate isomerase, class I [Phytohabitans houttuyneae]|uniref:mannose-6-phosphate isomerase n=1 Tax=Phytohabitans houttuyneae TaxID=1076126 RepID=A0A6V8KQP0_9ACTN|nr:mannose-6-phosphate isomerase, class I [Phytohabitans houttuyneae]GFJ84671.1 putative mannose-6-phosphate isomerase ManA [Phytohabitans houttuyneae]
MRLLTGRIRPYAWGSRTAIARLQGRPVPSEGPEAELWLGAHPGDPATVDGTSLTDLIAAEPERVLGGAVVARFGPRLPYLMKLLAAAAPLSLQAHPDAEQARERFAAGHPSYVDAYHKPEMLVAVSDFEALCGFRDPAASAAELSTLDAPALKPVLAALAAGDLRAAMADLIALPSAVVAEAAAAPDAPDLVRRLAAAYPGDPGVLVALLLNHVTLAPGEAIWMPAGNLHAYLEGTGVEIMAASDNVLRGGLTPKHVDVAELLRVLRFEVLADPVVPAEPVSPGIVTWRTPAAEFTLHRVRPSAGAVELAVTGPRVVLCLAGELAVDDGAGAVELATGQAAFAAAGSGALTIFGAGEAYVASVPA